MLEDAMWSLGILIGCVLLACSIVWFREWRRKRAKRKEIADLNRAFDGRRRERLAIFEILRHPVSGIVKLRAHRRSQELARDDHRDVQRLLELEADGVDSDAVSHYQSELVKADEELKEQKKLFGEP